MATLRQPSMRGVSVTELPLGQIDNETRSKLGLPQQLDSQARAFGEQTRARVQGASTASASAPITGGAQPTGAAPAQPVQSKMSAIRQRASGALRGLIPGGGATPAPAPASTAPAAAPRGGGVRGFLGNAAAGAAGFAAGQALTERREIPVAERQRRENLINQIPGQDGPALPYREAEFEPSRIERFGSELADNVTRALPALPMAAGANVFRASTAGAAAARPVVGAIRSAPAAVRSAGGAALGGAALGGAVESLMPREAQATTPGAASSGADARRATGDFDRGPTRTRDFSAELATAPRELPNDLPSNQIFRTTDAGGRVVYSGRDVTESARMVDGRGQPLPMRGTVSTVPGMSRDEIDRTLGRGQYAQGAEGGGGGATPMGGGLVASGGLLDTPKARRAAEALRQGSEQLANQRRGQDLNLQGIREGIAERQGNRRQDAAIAAAQQSRRAMFMRMAGGDPAQAARLAAENGFNDDAESFSGLADKGDARATKRNTAVQDFLKPLSITTNKDGEEEVSEAAVQRNTALLQSLAPQMGFNSVEALIADAPAARAAIKMINGLNSTRNNTISRAVGLDSAPRMTQLPNMAGAQDERVGLIRGAFTPGVSWGDRRIVTGQGNFYLPDEVWQDEDVQRFFRARTGQ